MKNTTLSRIMPIVDKNNKKHIANYSGSFAPGADMRYFQTVTITGYKQFLAFHTEQEAGEFQAKRTAAYPLTACEKQQVIEVAGADFELLDGGDCFVCACPMNPTTLFVRTSF